MLSLLFGMLAATTPGPQQAPGSIDVQVERIEQCPSNTSEGQRELFTARLLAAHAALAHALAPTLPVSDRPTLQLTLMEQGAAARQLASERCSMELLGAGVLHADGATAVLVRDPKHDRDAELWRACVHAATLCEVAAALGESQQRTLGYGWLAVGLAHRAEREATGTIDVCFVHGVLQERLPFWGGDWSRAANELLARQQLPSLSALLATEADALDFGERVLALTLVDWLHDSPLAGAAPTTHGDGAADAPRPTLLARLLQAGRDGRPATTALAEIGGAALDVLEQRLHEFVRRRAALSTQPRPVAHHATHPHLAVYVYTREPIRERHREVVDKALQRRRDAHTSGWRNADGAPELRVGPVNRGARFWHGDEAGKNIARAWPMVVVLEYERIGQPTAYLDCFRRVSGRNDGDGWLLDPTVDFVGHHNAQYATAFDERFGYLAVPDTPTGGHVGGSEFVHRGRVRWADGSVGVVGTWTAMEAPRSRNVEPWRAVQVPLVDWLADDSTSTLGARRIVAIRDLERELAVFGTDTVFRFPEIPPGLFAGRGGP